LNFLPQDEGVLLVEDNDNGIPVILPSEPNDVSEPRNGDFESGCFDDQGQRDCFCSLLLPFGLSNKNDDSL
jgi:hypothetical protein